MKQLKLIFIITITFLILPCSAAMITGFVTKEIITGNMIERDPLNFAVDQQNYTTGGVTFTYPAGWFTQPPLVQIAVIQNSAHPTTETFGAEVSANSTSSTTVMVYQVSSGGTVNEAPGSAITVCLLAIDNS